ncbi:trypsin-like peptidase domain-containing protein [Dietzia sp. SLG310A2-38A2]|uniref:S1 family peptidase n=1 Tax=Dietzia sp. SLG310A2-38A2 TaxID=1630643 RepID=UPI0015FB6D35|nr:serine protease [Dietzia sp. SLG310A2-38A2]MBB1032428.1 trypsin-like peptidase domain-containing protein [Dietzia sp. SLG310A2-38A2]
MGPRRTSALPLAAALLAAATACVQGGGEIPAALQNVPGVIESTSPAGEPSSMNLQDLDNSVVFLVTTVSGYVLEPGDGEGDGARSAEVTAVRTCTGWMAGEGGEIVTAGHCVGRDEGRGAVVASYLSDHDVADEAALVAEVEIRVMAGQPGVDGAIITDWVRARIVDVMPAEQGDLALLRIDGPGAGPRPPALAIARDDPRPGDRVTAIGFPGAGGGVSEERAIQPPSFKSGTVSTRRASPRGAAGYEIDADLGPGMAGGPIVDERGRVVGVNSHATRGGYKEFNVVTGTAELRRLLAGNGVG